MWVHGDFPRHSPRSGSLASRSAPPFGTAQRECKRWAGPLREIAGETAGIGRATRMMASFRIGREIAGRRRMEQRHHAHRDAVVASGDGVWADGGRWAPNW